MKRESFVFYRSFFEAIEKLKKNDKLTVYSHLCRYALGEEVDELEGVPGAIFDLIKPQIDANFQRYENGLKGGRPKTKTKPNRNRTITETEPNVNVNVNENVNDNENVNVCVEETSHTETKTHTIPTLDEVIRLAFQLGHAMTPEEAQRFIDYNTALGWKMDWKYALKRWFDHHVEKQKEQQNRWRNDPDQRKEYGGEIDWGC